MNQSRQDVPFSLRQLRRVPESSMIAVLTLSLGIGASLAVAVMHAACDSVLLNNLTAMLIAIGAAVSVSSARKTATVEQLQTLRMERGQR